MLNLKVKEKKIKSQEKRYIVSLAFNWTGKAKSKNDAESKARETFIQKIKDLNYLDLKKISRKKKAEIPLLSELLKASRNKFPLLLELKPIFSLKIISLLGASGDVLILQQNRPPSLKAILQNINRFGVLTAIVFECKLTVQNTFVRNSICLQKTYFKKLV